LTSRTGVVIHAEVFGLPEVNCLRASKNQTDHASAVRNF
jgi:hypothetical protein